MMSVVTHEVSDSRSGEGRYDEVMVEISGWPKEPDLPPHQYGRGGQPTLSCRLMSFVAGWHAPGAYMTESLPCIHSVGRYVLEANALSDKDRQDLVVCGNGRERLVVKFEDP